MGTQTAARPTASNTPARNYLAEVQSAGSGLPNRYMLYAVEGWGKTSLAAQAPKPIFIQSRGETGLETLIDSNQLPQVPHFPEAQTYAEVEGSIRSLIDGEHEYRTLVIDTVGGVERLIHEAVCTRDFANDWSDTGFMAYMRGYETSLADVRKFLSLLDELRMKKRMTVMLLGHSIVKPFQNPDGPSYDRYQPDMHQKTWSLIAKWADVVLFGKFDTQLKGVKSDKRTGEEKGKAIDMVQERMLYTQQRAAFVAKNRLGLADEIQMGDGPAKSWEILLTEIRKGKTKKEAA